MKLISVVIALLIASVAMAGDWYSFAPSWNTGANDTIYIIAAADDTSGAFQLTPSTSIQIEQVGTPATDSSAVGFYPVFASKTGYAECGSVPIAKFNHKWGTMDSTDFYGVYNISIDSAFTTGVGISPDAACPCARVVAKGLALNDSSRIMLHVSRYSE